VPALGIDIGATVQEKTDCGFIAASLGGCLERIAIVPALGIDIGATVQEKTDCGFIVASPLAAAWSALPYSPPWALTSAPRSRRRRTVASLPLCVRRLPGAHCHTPRPGH
jgi:hypothetical protein